MIKHHPTLAALKEFVTGNMDASVSVIVSSHVEMCDECQQQVHQLTESAAMDAFDVEESSLSIDEHAFDWSSGSVSTDMLNAIMDQPIETIQRDDSHATELEVSGRHFSVPRAIQSIPLKEWQGMGKVSRARLDLDDDERRMSLLSIEPKGNVPMHTHKGFEITLLLQGSFRDDMGTYQAGDFIWLDGNHTHNPVTEEGCICLTVSSDAIHFTQGVSQLFNPLGKLIY